MGYLFLLATALTGLLPLTGRAEHAPSEARLRVALRMIGHQFLQQAGDSTSRVLPVEKEGGRYRISFASKFQFLPDDLRQVADSILLKEGFATRYLLEVVQCQTGEVVYSYENSLNPSSQMLPCKGRPQPEDCYSLLIGLDPGPQIQIPDESGLTEIHEAATEFNPIWLGLPLLLALMLFLWYRPKKQSGENEENQISIGNYRFDPAAMRLWYGEGSEELSGKEAELLRILHRAENQTLERETILREVWGDEGNYVGRTLDVFISKLRKKLQKDPRVRIINIRGVGYRLVTQGEEE